MITSITSSKSSETSYNHGYNYLKPSLMEKHAKHTLHSYNHWKQLVLILCLVCTKEKKKHEKNNIESDKMCLMYCTYTWFW